MDAFLTLLNYPSKDDQCAWPWQCRVVVTGSSLVEEKSIETTWRGMIHAPVITMVPCANNATLSDCDG
jgi:hypothetical protein